MEKITEKMKAIQEAVNAIHTVNSMRPAAVSDDVLRLLAELRMDLLDLQDNRDGFFDIDNLL